MSVRTRGRINLSLFIIFFVAILAIGGYVMFSKNRSDVNLGINNGNTSKATSAPENEQTPVVEVVKTVPLNYLNFNKKVVSEDECNNPVGLVSYYDQKTAASMKINSLLLKHNEYLTEAIQKLNIFLEKGNISKYDRIDSFELAFHDYCGGSANFFLKQVKNINYPHVLDAKAITVLTTQAPGDGVVEINIYGKKGDDLIQLSKLLKTDNLYEPVRKKCNAENFKNDMVAVDKCYKDELYNNKVLEDLANKEAQALINLFSVE